MNFILKLLTPNPLAIFFIILVSIPKRLILPLSGIFAFNYDQGRDFLAVSKIIYEKDLVLIGQTTGLQGVFYGPWWYYFLAPLIFIAGGDPQKVALFFAFIGVMTVVATYLLLKTLTDNLLISFGLSFVSATSILWMLGPIHIWNPTLTPLLLTFFIYMLHLIAKNPKPLYFFILGISAFLTIDTTASFGFPLAIFLLISPFIFKKTLMRREYIFVFLGAFTILMPRIIFEVRNNWLITKSLISFLTNPPLRIHQTPIYERLISRLEQFLRIFSEGFTREIKIIGLILFLVIIAILIKIVLSKTYLKLKQDFVFLYLSSLFTFSLIFFVIYPTDVWDYYLVGIPTVVLVIIAKILSYANENKNLSRLVLFILGSLIILNFRSNLLPPYRSSWGGDGGTYNNEKSVIDYIAQQKPQSYSIYAYSPAIFDYSFDYLIYWYERRKLLEKPKERQNLMYLIIREASSKGYLKSGWYGDKTRDKTKIIESKSFNGDLLLEKHLSE